MLWQRASLTNLILPFSLFCCTTRLVDLMYRCRCSSSMRTKCRFIFLLCNSSLRSLSPSTWSSGPSKDSTADTWRGWRKRFRQQNSSTLLLIWKAIGSAGKESAYNAGDLGLIPGLGRSPREGKGYPLQYSGLENSMDCIVHGVAESDMTEWLSSFQRYCQEFVRTSSVHRRLWMDRPGSALEGFNRYCWRKQSW